MPLTSNSVKDIEIYVADQMAAPQFPAVAAANLKTGAQYRYRAAYVTDTSRPAWCDVNGVWRYADGTTV